MLALERSLLRGFLSAAESLEWKQGEVAAAGEGRSRPGWGRGGGKVPGRCCGYPEPPTSPLASGRAGAAAGGSLYIRVPLPPFLPFAGLRGAPAGAAVRGEGPLGSSAWRGGSGSAGRAEARGAAAAPGLPSEFIDGYLPLRVGFRRRGCGCSGAGPVAGGTPRRPASCRRLLIPVRPSSGPMARGWKAAGIWQRYETRSSRKT